MNRNDYRAAFDSVQFSPTFQRDTVNRLLDEAEQRTEKENETMNAKKIRNMPLIAAALAAVLLMSAAAATLFLHPADVAREMGDTALAEAFESPDAVILDQTQDSGDYRFHLAGLVSGAGLTGLDDSVERDRTYLVASVSRIDGQPMEVDPFQFTFTPLVAGQLPWQTNAWTLGGGYTRRNIDGTEYYIYEYDSLTQFAGKTVYLAAYEGFSPDSDTFQMAEDGSISYTDSFTAPHALFTLPLDSAPAAN